MIPEAIISISLSDESPEVYLNLFQIVEFIFPNLPAKQMPVKEEAEKQARMAVDIMMKRFSGSTV